MYYIYESIFTGLFCLLIYSILTPLLNMKDSFFIILFILGFLKHSLGYLFQIQTYYCSIYKSPSSKASSPTFGENILEGIFFIIIGFFLSLFINNKYMITFLIGFFIHVIAEVSGIHDYYISKKCIYY